MVLSFLGFSLLRKIFSLLGFLLENFSLDKIKFLGLQLPITCYNRGHDATTGRKRKPFQGVQTMKRKATGNTLTEAQARLLDVYCRYAFENGKPPAMRTLGALLPNEKTGKDAAVNGIKQKLEEICKKGYLELRDQDKSAPYAITYFSEHDNRFGQAADAGRRLLVFPLNGKIVVQIHSAEGMETREFTHEQAILTAKHTGVQLWIGNPYSNLAEIALEKL